MQILQLYSDARMQRDSFICAQWYVNCVDLLKNVAWFVDRLMWQSQRSCIWAPWLFRMCNVTHLYMQHDSFLCVQCYVPCVLPWVYGRIRGLNHVTNLRQYWYGKVTVLIYMILDFVTWLNPRTRNSRDESCHTSTIIYMRNATQLYIQRESFICATPRMQCVAVCGSVWQCVAVCCSVLQCATVYCSNTYNTNHSCAQLHVCSVLQCVAACCSVLQCVAVCCSVLQCVAVCCSMLQCIAVALMHMCNVTRSDVCNDMFTALTFCSVVQCVAVCCSVLQLHPCILQRDSFRCVRWYVHCVGVCDSCILAMWLMNMCAVLSCSLWAWGLVRRVSSWSEFAEWVRGVSHANDASEIIYRNNMTHV